MSDDEISYKICLIGDGGVGKTSLRKRFTGEEFPENYLETIGADFSSKRWVIDGQAFTFGLWDLAGQPRFEMVRKLFYRGAVGALVVGDVTRAKTFENSVPWIREFWEHNGRGKRPILIVGNKLDLRPSNVEGSGVQFVQRKHGQLLARGLSEITRKHGWETEYAETSAKTGLSVVEVFEKIGRLVVQH